MQEENVLAAQRATADPLPDGDGNWQNDRMSIDTQSGCDTALEAQEEAHAEEQHAASDSEVND